MPVVPSKPEDFPVATSSRDQKQTEGAKKASAQDHVSKGPVIPNEMPPKASREEIEARMKELNQK
ncbi:conserved hypothetical protein [Talaromyces stipitatus ATCC 10500]|uniref:Uncharacterized protein n=1 Tax=Talaromyces stipitatus (strain ATCC 10500 / CBS 375.48 / QM 6759 / NRRL 1006) TaxID=441959 RepID=B8M4W5_TALSN|nr:uncharacterized protein TSTA_027010 [Talaromyces stipitatus ATCC 10500]EED19400.1 conserved hypothetical protein [Talaromyces stipitatus ATCC 10500]